MELAKHRWVRHTLQEVVVKRTISHPTEAPEDPEFEIVPKLDGQDRSVVGCDNCGLPLTAALYSEPCLAALEDQLEDSDEPSG